ncbi:MAG: hypothetical protein WBN92_15455 [Terriglobia bacterium]
MVGIVRPKGLNVPVSFQIAPSSLEHVIRLALSHCTIVVSDRGSKQKLSRLRRKAIHVLHRGNDDQVRDAGREVASFLRQVDPKLTTKLNSLCAEEI